MDRELGTPLVPCNLIVFNLTKTNNDSQLPDNDNDMILVKFGITLLPQSGIITKLAFKTNHGLLKVIISNILEVFFSILCLKCILRR